MIKQAIIPLAGLGTRLLPLTSVLPKELLPINGKPGLEYILDECIESGIKEFIFIISKKKQVIKKYFYNDSFYKKGTLNKPLSLNFFELKISFAHSYNCPFNHIVCGSLTCFLGLKKTVFLYLSK